MHWLDWDDDAFGRARQRGVPVLLFLHASWCRFCRELERAVLEEPRVRRLVEERFVAVRVDKDRRPDIDARYSKGGWPTLAYLTETGEPIASDTYLEVDEILPRLRLVSEHYAENRAALRRRLAEAAEARGEARSPASTLSGEIVTWVARTLVETADPLYGGWGSPQKFPHPEALDFALARWSRTGDEGLRQVVLRSLRHMQEGQIHDRVEGGFYRYAAAQDWSAPHHEKMLDSNSQRLSAYLMAHQALGEPSFRATAESILRYLYGTLLDPHTGAFRGSQDADPVYANLPTPEARRARGAPAVDPTIFANWNAMAVIALLQAAVVLGEERHRGQALRTLDFLLEELLDERLGVYHYWDGTYHLPGLLSDQAYTLRALVEAAQHTGEARYLDAARRLADLAQESLRSESGGFYDTRYDPSARGSLRRRNRSILENAVMAEALLYLAQLTRIEDYADTARETLAAFAGDYKRYGHYVAGYARAVDLCLDDPVHVTIVGPAGGRATRALRDAAMRTFIAGRVVQPIDPAADPQLLERAGLPRDRDGGDGARAYVHRGRESFAETDDPARLPVLMARLERGS